MLKQQSSIVSVEDRVPVAEHQENRMNQYNIAEDGLEKIEQEGDDESKIDDEIGDMPLNLKGSKSNSAIKTEIVSEEYSDFLNVTGSKA